MKILVVSLAGIGDTLFATPLIHELRENLPEAVIDCLVLWAGARDLLEGNPNLNTIHQKNLIRVGTGKSLHFLGGLRRNRYDISINTHPQSRVHYRIVARLINAQVRSSHKYDNYTRFDRLLVNRMLDQDYEKHSIENNLGLMEFLGVKPKLPNHNYEIYLSQIHSSWADDFIRSNGLESHKLLGIHVGSGGTKNLALRRWPIASFVELIKRLNRSHPHLAVLLFGGPEEEKDHEIILSQTDRTVVFQPSTKTLREAAALLKRCQAFLSVDTSLMHLAAAMKVPNQIVIETPTWNRPIHPYGNPFLLVKNPAVAGRNLEYYRYDGRGIRGTDEEITKCMASVSVESVYETVASAPGVAA